MKHMFSINFIKKIIEQTGKREIKGLPEQIAFNLVMAIVPLIVVIVQLATYLSIDTNIVEQLIVQYAPTEIQTLLQSFISPPVSSSATTIFLITTGLTFFWLISKGFDGIANAANTTYQVPLMKFPYLERIISFILVLGIIVMLTVILLLVFFGQIILTVVFQLLDLTIRQDWILLLHVLKTIISFTAYFMFFTLLFYLAPNIKMKATDVIPGALVTAVGWSIASTVFSFYVSHIANYNKFYGSLSVIIILLFWLYILGYTIVIGLQVNYVLARDYFGG
ncbi:MAG TPA: YihY/virulence factor BrkB family protein, partial [Firmicutes bacterium]|nr:YihY/virulence factor BrkB family protein [Bacillota bacterium]